MIDYLSVLQTYLAAEVILTTQTSTRIWRNQVPMDEQGDMPQKSLVLVSEPGGAVGMMTPVLHARFQARCYGANAAECVAVADALYDVLHRITDAHDVTYSSLDYRMFHSKWMSPGYFIPEPETQWPCWLVPCEAWFYDQGLGEGYLTTEAGDLITTEAGDLFTTEVG